jgi:geranylgeranyl reductase family protein
VLSSATVSTILLKNFGNIPLFENPMEKYDTIIVGGGPIGGYVSEKIAEKNYNIAVFEKNKKIGQTVNCAGLITPRVFDILNISQKNIVQNQIKGANIHSPSNHVLSVGGDRVHALVIDRSIFDKQIMQRSERKGTKVFIDNNVESIQRKNGYIEIKTSKKLDFKTRLLIGADGPFSTVRDRLVFPEPKEYLKGIGCELSGVKLDPDFVEIFVGNQIAPGFFAWIIPINEDGTNARVGLCASQKNTHSPKFYLSNFLKNKHTKVFFEKTKITKHTGGVIPLGVLNRTFDNNIMLVGDAAAQVKPTSGGGIFPGLFCADICSSVAIQALEKNDFSSQFLKSYHKTLMKDVGKELVRGMRFRYIFKNLNDKQMDKYVKMFQNQKIVDAINRYGDIDYPSKLMKPLIKKLPSLFRLLPSMIKK